MGGMAEQAFSWPVALVLLLSFLLTGLAAWYARRRGLLDHPGARHSHTEATPRGGGAGLVAALLIVSWLPAVGGSSPFWTLCILPGVAVLALTGWWDDHRSLSARLRFAVQLAVSLYLVACAGSAGWIDGIVPAAVACLLLIWMANLYNFMDGSNGMAGLQGVFAAAVLAWLFQRSGQAPAALFSLLVAAACMGFLPWNLGRARVFMGDVGSVALGFVLAALLLYGTGTGAFDLPVAWLVMLLFLTDSTLTLMSRVMKGERWYNAHRQHLYQRLIAHGWTHGSVVLLYQAINVALVLPGIVVAVNFPVLARAVALALTLSFVLGWYLLTRKFGVLAQAG